MMLLIGAEVAVAHPPLPVVFSTRNPHPAGGCRWVRLVCIGKHDGITGASRIEGGGQSGNANTNSQL